MEDYGCAGPRSQGCVRPALQVGPRSRGTRAGAASSRLRRWSLVDIVLVDVVLVAGILQDGAAKMTKDAKKHEISLKENVIWDSGASGLKAETKLMNQLEEIFIERGVI